MESLCEAGAGLRAACGRAGAGLGSGGGTCGWRAGPRSWQEGARVLRRPWGVGGLRARLAGGRPCAGGTFTGEKRRVENVANRRGMARCVLPLGCSNLQEFCTVSGIKNSHFAGSNDHALKNKF